MCSFCTRLIDSIPPATAIFTPSSTTERAATAIACKPEAHCRSIVVPATVTGNPARIAHLRASDRLPDHMPGHCRTFGIVQRAAKGLSDWRARGRNNYGLGHAVLQFASGHAAFAARSVGTGGYRGSTDADPNTSSACDAKHAPDGLPLQGQILCSDAREHQAFAARLTPGGGLLESGTKKSSDSGWLGSTR